MKLKRTRTCGELTTSNINEEVILNGWVRKVRNLGSLVFIDLRDRYGVTQVVTSKDGAKGADPSSFRAEWVVAVKGKVVKREEINKNNPTGEIEVAADEFEVLNESDVPPFTISPDDPSTEETKLKYRFLDLRNERLQKNLIIRHKMLQVIHKHLDEKGFLELETPTMTKATPEGARDYLVPSRISPGSFYALPQSPQIFKQLFMVAGYDKYFQLARCYRDEDLRADRQPEFTQLDIEMSFCVEEDVLNVIEALLIVLVKEIKNVDVPKFPRMTYDEAMGKYGIDKPDTRFDLILKDMSDSFKNSEFKAFKGVLDSGGIIKGFNAKGCGKYSRKIIDELTEFVKKYGAKGLVSIKKEDGEIKSNILKFLKEDEVKAIDTNLEMQDGDLGLMVASDFDITNASLSALRGEIAKRENLIDESKMNFLWVTDFPMFEYSKEEDVWNAMHHPFTQANLSKEKISDLKDNPGSVKARAYDAVLNGVELGSGSIRNHEVDFQKEIFKLLGMSDIERDKKFGFLLKALSYGAPPHGGFAFGVDRFAMILAGEKSIREVIAFPKTTSAQCLMTEAPSEIDEKTLGELGISVKKK